MGGEGGGISYFRIPSVRPFAASNSEAGEYYFVDECIPSVLDSGFQGSEVDFQRNRFCVQNQLEVGLKCTSLV